MTRFIADATIEEKRPVITNNRVDPSATPSFQEIVLSATDKELVARCMYFAGHMIHRGAMEWLHLFEQLFDGFNDYGTPDQILERLRLGAAMQKMMEKR